MSDCRPTTKRVAWAFVLVVLFASYAQVFAQVSGVQVKQGDKAVFINIHGHTVLLDEGAVFYVDEVIGSGPELKTGDKMHARFKTYHLGKEDQPIGQTAEGKVSLVDLTDPATMKGLQTGLLGMQAGGKRRIYMHSSMAMTDWDTPKHRTLVHVVEIEMVRHLPGITLEMIERGRGWPVKPGDYVDVHYTGTLDDGTVFDTSRDDDKPFRGAVGSSSLIEGWNVAFDGKRPGAKFKLTVPPHLAYGDKERPNIPPNSTLHFDCELVGSMPGVTWVTEQDGVGDRQVQLGDKIEFHMKLVSVEGAVLQDTQFGKTLTIPVKTTVSPRGIVWGVLGMKKNEIRVITIPKEWGQPQGEGSNRALQATIDLVDFK